MFGLGQADDWNWELKWRAQALKDKPLVLGKSIHCRAVGS